jgi:CheY-like chemotaxis protein
VDFALAARARRLALFHHDPSRTDRAIDLLLASCRKRLPADGGPEVFAAAEGQYLVVVRPGGGLTAATPAGASSAERAALRNKTTILVADDDPDVMAVIVDALEPEGYRVLTASDGDAALQLAREERPDIVVLDWMMPGQDGLSVCRALRQELDPRLADVPVVLITGRADARDTEAGFNAGVTDYLTKPFKPTHLLARLQSWLIRAQNSE